MAFFTSVMRGVTEQFANWGPLLEDSFADAEDATLLRWAGLYSPPEQWRSWNVQDLHTIEEFRAALREAESCAFREEVKSTLFSFGVSVATVFLVAALAVATLFLAFLPLIAAESLDAAYFGGMLLSEATLLGGLTDFFFSIGVTIYWMAPVLMRVMYYAPRLWTKELFPAMTRMEQCTAHFQGQTYLIRNAFERWQDERRRPFGDAAAFIPREVL
ncbi:MAG: hypothetical protein HYX48_03625 [Chlamydiales bacterium]|nr:hypothetical protein [Chlamydiales bacterium]